MSSLAEVVERRHGDLVVAGLQGEVDASNAAWVGAKLRAMLTNRSDVLAIDLTGTTYLDSAGLALLFSLANELRLHQQELRLVIGETSPIARMVRITGLDATVPTFPTVDEALAG